MVESKKFDIEGTKEIKDVEEKSKSSFEESREIKMFPGLTMAKVFGFGAAMLSVLGVLYQRGVYQAAGMGNVEINTSVHEVLYYGYEALIQLAYAFVKNFSFSKYMFDNWHFSLMILVFGPVFSFLNKRREPIRRVFKHKLLSHLESPWVAISASIFAFISFVVGKVLFLGVLVMPLFFVVLFGFLGLETGQNKIEGIAASGTSCQNDLKNEELREMVGNNNGFITTCLRFTVDDVTFIGKPIINNGDGYLIALKQSFVYISKDSSRCYFKNYQNNKSAKAELERLKSLGDMEAYEVPGNNLLENICIGDTVIR